MARTLLEQTNSLASYLPSGRVWAAKSIDGTVVRGLLAGLSGELIRSESLVDEFRDQIIPDETLLYVNEWESALGIPDDCFTGQGSLDERRRDVLAKLASLGVQTARDMERLALAIYGISLTITTPTSDELNVFPYTFNPTGEADPNSDGGELSFNNSELASKFQIIIQYLDLPVAVLFPYTFPIPFLTREVAVIECLIRKLRPANVGFTQQIPIPTESPVPPPVPPTLNLSDHSVEIDRAVAYTALETTAATDYTTFDFRVPNASTRQISLACWAKSTGTATTTGTLMHLGDIVGAVTNRFEIQNNSTTGTIFVDFERSTGSPAIKRWTTAAASTPTSASPEWFHVAVTYDGGSDANSLKIFIDGVIIVGGTITKTLDGDLSGMVQLDLHGALGSFKALGNNIQPAKHNLFMCATWDRELISDEIAEMYANGDGNFDLRIDQGNYLGAANLQSYWLPGSTPDPTIATDLGPASIDMNVATTIDATDPNERIRDDIPTGS